MLTRKGQARRQLLASSAQSAMLYLPLMRLFKDSQALAADTIAQPNAIFCYYPLGFKESQRTFTTGTDGSITAFSQIHKPFETAGFKNDFLMIDGASFLGCENHNGAHCQVLAGWGKANAATGYGLLSSGNTFNDVLSINDLDAKPYSLDQQIADKWKTKSMVVGVKTGRDFSNFYEALSFKADGSRAYAEDNPMNTFNNFFGGFKSGMMGTTEQREAEKKVAAAEARVVDFLKADIKRVESQLGSEDKAAFQSHVSALDAVNKSIVDAANGTADQNTANCDFDGLKSKVPMDNSKWWAEEDKVGQVIEISRALIVQALACGVTRVAVFQIGTTHSYSQLRATGIGQKTGDYHEMSHGDRDNFIADFAEVQTGLMREFAQLGTDLKNAKVYDNSLMFITSDGGNDSGHSRTRVPVVFLGSLGGKMNAGRVVKTDYYNNVLVTMAHAVGINDINYVGNKTRTGVVTGVLK